MDCRITASQILRALRGRRSQRAFSRRLGYRANVAHDWESGRRTPTALDALRACKRLGVNIPVAFERFQPACAGVLGDGPEFEIAAWLRELAGSATLAELAVKSGLSRHAVGRHLRGTTRPKLDDFVALVEAISGRVSDLVQELVPITEVPELLSIARQRAAAKRLAFDEPWSAAVLRVLETSGYRAQERHRPGYVAQRLELKPDRESEIINALEAAGVVRFEAERYEAGQPLTVDTQASPEDVRALRAHWTNVALSRIAEPRAEDWLGFNVISSSATDLERVRDVLRRAFREIRTIAAASEPAESVALLNLQLVTWNEKGS
jgi:transcriptional regulator with XRE-family HTH domain